MIRCVRQVVSGGQTGADLGGLYAALNLDIATGGWAPHGYMTELGPRPALLRSLGLREHASPQYPPRTAANIYGSSFTLIMTRDRHMDGGSRLTKTLCFRMKKSVFNVTMDDMTDSQSFDDVVDWVGRRHPRPWIINVAGNRESKAPGIERATEKFMTDLLGALHFFYG